MIEFYFYVLMFWLVLCIISALINIIISIVSIKNKKFFIVGEFGKVKSLRSYLLGRILDFLLFSFLLFCLFNIKGGAF